MSSIQNKSTALFNKIEGKVTFSSAISSFTYKNGCGGYVQHFIITDMVKKGNNEPVYDFKVVVWNDKVQENLLKPDTFYIISNFNIKESQYSGVPAEQSRFEVHLKKNSIIEEVPYLNFFM